MQEVRYSAPRTLDEAIRLISVEPGAAPLAGGTDLLIQFRAGIKPLRSFVDLKRIPQLMGVTIDAQGLRLGAATPAAEVTANAELQRLWPGLAESVRLIGSTQIQGRGSVGGNLCNGSPAADTTCSLIVNRAQCIVAGPAGERRVAAEAFCTGPGQTVLAKGELLVAIQIPRPAPRTGDAYLRLIPRTEMDIAVAGAAVSVTLDEGGTCRAARVAIGAVAPTALLVPEAAAALIGSRLDDAALTHAADAASRTANPIDDKRGT